MTRGFIRNYARLLEIDPEPVLQAYQRDASSQTNHPLTIKSQNILISSTQKPVWKKYIISSLVILVLIGAWVIYMDYFHGTAQHNASLPVAQSGNAAEQLKPDTNEPMPEPALPRAERDAASEVTAQPAEVNENDKPSESKVLPDGTLPASTSAAVTEKSTAQTITDVSNQPPKPSLSLSSVAVPATAQMSTQTPTPSSVGATAKTILKIQFTFSESAWVSVLDADNKEVLNKTGHQGSHEEIEVTPPAKLIIGNANGTHLQVNNKSIDLTPYNKLNVVRLTLE
jgi:cytoskeleton protein RodZ